MMQVLFACVHNAGRSQMAAAFFNQITDPSLAQAISAGTAPAARIHPEVLNVMREVGIELGGVTPRMLTPELASQANMLVTMGCGESCPVAPGAKREDWNLPDPKRQPLEGVRQIRDEIRKRVQEMAKANGWSKK
jgi:arsenate reductase (thioredoxin)